MLISSAGKSIKKQGKKKKNMKGGVEQNKRGRMRERGKGEEGQVRDQNNVLEPLS